MKETWKEFNLMSSVMYEIKKKLIYAEEKIKSQLFCQDVTI